MKKHILILLPFLLVFTVLAEATTNRYRLSYRDDPATTVVVGWNQVNGSNPVVYYGTEDFGTMWNLYPMSKTVDRQASHRGMDNRFARLTGLQPNTVYYFVIKDDNSVSVRMSFRTLSDNSNHPFMFVSGGDTRTGVITEYDYQNCRNHRQSGNRLVGKIRPDFVAFTGDFVLLKSSNSQWNDWFDDWQLTMTAGENRMYPVIITFGNHEDAEDAYKFFDVPIADAYFAINFHGDLMRLYSLNSDLDPCGYAPQRNWLTNDLQMHTGTSIEPYWKSAQYHLPMVPHGQYAPVTPQINCWANLFRDYGVKLGMEGHTHVIKQTWPVSPSSATGSQKGFILDTINGTVYIGEGCWGAPLRHLYAPNNWTRDQGRFMAFQLVYVEKSKIEIRTAKFENVNNVGQVALNAPSGTLPSNIVLWSPPNGQVVVINNTLLPGNDPTLSMLSTNTGTLNPVFNSNITNYSVVLPFGTTTTPAISATTTDPFASAQITQPTSPNSTGTVLVTAADGSTTKTYTVQFSVATGDDATLSSLNSSMGVLMPAFHPNSFSYNVMLPFGTVVVPTVTAQATDPNATVNIAQPASVTDAATVTVTSANGSNTNVYTVQYMLGSASDKDIVSFDIPGQIGTSVIGQTNATIEVLMPYATNVTALAPMISITGAYVIPSSGMPQDFTNPVLYTVTAMDSSQKNYMINVSIEQGSGDDASLIHLETDIGQLNPPFAPDITNYTVYYNTPPALVSITAITADPSATKKVFLPANYTGNVAERTANILVISRNQTVTKTYSVKFEMAASISDKEMQKNVHIYPNPTQGIVNIEFNDRHVYNAIEIYNGMGKFIASERVRSNTRQVVFDLSNQEKGVYYIYFKSRRNVEAYKVFVL